MNKFKIKIDIKFLIIYFTLLTIIMTYPFLVVMPHSTFLGYSSSTVSIWILDSIFYSLTTDPANFFNANIYYPLDHTRVFGDISIFTAIIYGIFKLIFRNPVFSYNLLLFLTFIFTGITTFYVIKYNTKENLASLALATFFTFCLTRMPYTSHIQIINFGLIALIVLFWQKFLDMGKWQDFSITAIALMLQFYTGYYNFSFIIIFLIILTLIYNPKALIQIFKSNQWWKILIILAIVLLPMLPTLIVNYQTGEQYGMQREKIVGSEIQYYLSASPHSLIYSNFLKDGRPNDQTRGNEGHFNGFLIFVLFLLSIYYIFRKGYNGKKILIFIILTLCAFLFSLGPDIYFFGKKIFIGPYHLIENFPLLMGVRAPFRFTQFFAFFLSICGALGLTGFFTNLKLKKPLQIFLTAIIIIVFLLENKVLFKNRLIQIQYGKSIPPYCKEIKNLKDTKAIIGFPYFSPHNDLRAHSIREYFSIYHRKNIVSGFSGFIPAYITELATEASFFPDNRMVAFLSGHEINYVIIHKNDYHGVINSYYNLQRLQETVDKLNRMKEFEKYYEDDEAYIYKLKQPDLKVETDDSKIMEHLITNFNLPNKVKPLSKFIWSITMKNNSDEYLVPKPSLLNKQYYIKLNWVKEDEVYYSETFNGYLKHKGYKTIFWPNREMWFPILFEPEEVAIKQFESPTPKENGVYYVRISGYIANLNIELSKTITIDSNLKYSTEKSQDKFLVEYLDYKIPTKMKKDTLFQAILKVKNISNYNFSNLITLAGGTKIEIPKGTVRVAGIWYKDNQLILDEKIVLNHRRNNLICDVSPNQTVELPIIIHTPKVSGEYQLKLTLVNEWILWDGLEPSKPPLITVNIED